MNVFEIISQSLTFGPATQMQCWRRDTEWKCKCNLNFPLKKEIQEWLKRHHFYMRRSDFNSTFFAARNPSHSCCKSQGKLRSDTELCLDWCVTDRIMKCICITVMHRSKQGRNAVVQRVTPKMQAARRERNATLFTVTHRNAACFHPARRGCGYIPYASCGDMRCLLL